MLYIEFGAIIVLLVAVFVLLKRNRKEEQDVIETISKLNVSEEELEKHAEQVSKLTSISSKAIIKRNLIGNLNKSYKKIIHGYEYIDAEVKGKNEVPSSAEWLLDNLYIIEKEYKEILKNMPKTYYNDLPVMSEGSMKGYPRVYFLALQLVSNIDGKVSEKNVEKFINAYQREKRLTMGELWAIPILIKVALIQNIATITERIVYAQKQRNRGEVIAEKIIACGESKIETYIKNLNDTSINFNCHFTEKLIKILRDNGVENALVYNWIDENLAKSDSDAEKIIFMEHQMQSYYQVLMGNCITGIIEVNSMSWKEAFNKLSVVEKILKEDPQGTYDQMDFRSKDYYRHKIEKLAKHMDYAESFIAKKAIECAKASEKKGNKEEAYKNHVGYYIADEGIQCLKKNIGYREKGIRRVKNIIRKNKVGWYIGTIISATLLLIALVLLAAANEDFSIVGWRYLIAFVALIIPCSEIIISALNWSINGFNDPKHIPKLELKDGILEQHCTMVVIPTIVNNSDRVKSLIDNMEVYYLANREENLYFGILGDFKDSKTENQEDDLSIVKEALKQVSLLNKKYSKKGEDIFYFLNRYRQFNKKEGIWLGWERKRGKLVEFNRLIRGAKDTSYNVISGEVTRLNKIKYVITLDADTQLPRDAAKKLIGAMAHPLNLPYIHKKSKKVLRGHGLMQPRIGVSASSANKTFFSKVFSGETGIDLYTTAVSDVYQDLFQEGIFTGKGIYEVDVFNEVLEGQLPENLVLSHDLLEGCYVRAALVTDIELIDGYPAYYNASCKRLHRWIRGDWQIVSWLWKKSPLNLLSRWKILDNLRRSLLAPSIIILIGLSFSVLPLTDEWIIVAFTAILCPIFFDVSEAVILPVKGISLSGKMNNGKLLIEQVFLIFCFLPYQAVLMLDAIIRTLYRLCISGKNLLEWQPAADAEALSGKQLRDFIKSMWSGSLVAVIVTLLAFNRGGTIGILMIPSFVVWFLSPYIAYYISFHTEEPVEKLKGEEADLIRSLARRTWAYFEDFVCQKDNWLAPDNFQDQPNNGIAHRTSPTNMAMGLTSNLVAYDLGYIGIYQLFQRLEQIYINMESLEKYKGHFYNWYDTITKESLKPKYVSTVDSGNLVGYLWLLNAAMQEYLNLPLVRKIQNQGIKDTLKIAMEGLDTVNTNNVVDSVEKFQFGVDDWKDFLENLRVEVDKSFKNNSYWFQKLKGQIDSALFEVEKLCPWTHLLNKTLCKNEKFAWISIELNNMLENDPITYLPTRLFEIKTKIEETVKSSDHGLLKELLDGFDESSKEINHLVKSIEKLQNKFKAMANATDFKVLYNKKIQLFSIGYDMDKESMGNCYYDLLASEARQASFVAIAKGDIKQEHWFKLGRSLVSVGRNKALVSWSGTMFEYLMPLLIMKSYPSTLLHQTYKTVVELQQKYGMDRKVPWGISESAFYSFDIALNYQYMAFGVPRLGLKRGLNKELVVAPYASIMALQVHGKGAFNNIVKLIEQGALGKYGLYEAIDYTKSRLSKGKKKEIIKCFMVHHQGMSLMSIDNVLNENILQERFHSIPEVKATELLLQEKVCKNIVYDRENKYENSQVVVKKTNTIARRYNTLKTEIPETHLMSNGSYCMMITNSGSGYSKKGDISLYRWREDVTNDNTGRFFYIKNLNSNEFWSDTYEPCKNQGEKYEAIFSLDKAEFKRKDGNLTTHTEVTVSQEDNAEVRVINISNHSEHNRILEITSYCEVTLSPYLADLVHPAFSNLFIKTEHLEGTNCVIASRKPRAKNESQNWLMETVTLEGNQIGTVEYETSRANFIGRCRDLVSPQAMDNEASLSRTVGAVLDPIISIRIRVNIPKGESCKVAFTLGAGATREEVISLAKKYKDMNNINRIFELSSTQATVEMKYLGLKSPQANLYQLMASKILFLNHSFKHREQYIKNIKTGQSALWSYGISGDVPIVLVVVKNDSHKDMVRQLLIAHEYWCLKGLKVDLVILNLKNASYIQTLQEDIRNLICSSHARDKQNKSGGVFLYSKGNMEEKDIDLLMAIARLVIDCEKSLVTQIKNSINGIKDGMLLEKTNKAYTFKPYKIPIPEYQYFNGFGGFNKEGDKYLILLKDYINTPAPWINVISNEKFGFHISENGVAYTWNKNSRENKLTAWSNDPVIDPEAEAHYIRDEETGELWSISAKPIRDEGEYLISHGFGYSSYEHFASGILGEMTTFVPREESLKICIFKFKNLSEEERHLSLTYYGKLVQGVTHELTAQYLVTDYNEEENYMFSYNSYSEHFKNLNCYLKIIGGEQQSYTGNRKEFLGRGGHLQSPRGLNFESLSNTTGAGMDPCLAMNSKFTLKKDEEKQIIVIFGEDKEFEHIKNSISKYSTIEAVNSALISVREYWSKLLGTIQVKTPDKTMDIMLNGWLMYQVISCRFWARTAFYQSGGAYGFRDQLQDVMAVTYLNPSITKEHIEYSASKQYVEGDVQHWWHPVVESGIRTKFSDDLLWLPYVAIDYIKNTGDFSILDKEAGYLEDEPLGEEQDERYNMSRVSEKTGSIYEHCIKAIDRACKFGQHNIPLMGCGDWNDGMNKIGNKGKGESVWVGWFLYSILDEFIHICRVKNHEETAQKYEKTKEFIKENLEKNAWDGGWYRRAYFDDGTPLGSKENDECQIDSLSQTWAVISGAARASRAKESMDALEKNLIKEDKAIVMLFAPAFDKSKLEPGYIKGYVPGVRENGGQYTHAAIWVVLAYARMGEGNKASKIFNMLNPINHAKSYLECQNYKVEPYVMVADIYAVEPHTGRGGWSWYTGAAGWMYRSGIEGILGLKLIEGKGFTIKPCIPEDWDNYNITYTREDSVYNISVERGSEKAMYLNNKLIEDIILFQGKGIYEVRIII